MRDPDIISRYVVAVDISVQHPESFNSLKLRKLVHAAVKNAMKRAEDNAFDVYPYSDDENIAFTFEGVS